METDTIVEYWVHCTIKIHLPAGSLSILPKLPCPSISGVPVEKSCAKRTKAS